MERQYRHVPSAAEWCQKLQTVIILHVTIAKTLSACYVEKRLSQII